MKKTHQKRKLWLDRLLSKNILRQLGVLAVALLIVLGVSYLFLAFSGSDWKAYCQAHDLNMLLLPLYLLIDSNALNNLYVDGHVHGWMLFASSITFLFGAFIFNGVIIGIITNSIERRVKEHKEGHLHYLESGHYIIMGYDDIVPSIIAHIFEKDTQAYVLILTSAEVVHIREALSKSFNKEKMKHIILNYGHRVSIEAYKDIHLESAEQIFVVGNRMRSAHDAINVECVDSICRYLSNPKITQRPSRIVCMFNDLDTYAAFKTSNIFEKVHELGIDFVPYNFFAGWAKQVFIKRYYHDMDEPDKKHEYPTVYGNGITPDDEKYVHLVFVGTTNFAVAFAMEAAHVLHFPNFNRDKELRTRITFIDINADKEKDEFIIRNRHFFEVQSYRYKDLSSRTIQDKLSDWPETKATLFRNKGIDCDFLDVEFEFVKGDVFSPKVQNLIDTWAQDDKNQYLSIFLALSDQRQNFVMGMNMPDSVYDRGVNVFIRQDRSDNFVTRLRTSDEIVESTYAAVNGEVLETPKRKARFSHFYPFGMNETGYSEDERSLKRAKLINYLYATANYDSYKFQSLMALNALSEETIWREADEKWNKLSVSLKWSNLYSAYAIRTKLATLRAMRGMDDVNDKSRDIQPLTDYEAEQLAAVEHNRWNVEKLLMGFRKAKDAEDKYAHPEYADQLAKNKKLFIHHDIRPFKILGPIRELDYEFSRYIPWIMKMTEGDDKDN